MHLLLPSLFCVGAVLFAQTVPLTRTPAPEALPNLQDITAGVQALEQAEQAHRYVLSRRAFGRVLLRP